MTAPLLPGYEAQLHESGVQHSVEKLETSRQDLVEWAADVTRCHPADNEDETVAYRCTCSFQLIDVAAETEGKEQKDGNDDRVHNTRKRLAYAMRHQGSPLALGDDVFPIATKRIQAAMSGLLETLNTPCKDQSASVLCTHLTSVSFASSWNDQCPSNDTNGSDTMTTGIDDNDNGERMQSSCDCFVTLHYNQPIDKVDMWKEHAGRVVDNLWLTKLSGRSKGKLTVVYGPEQRDYIHDTIWMERIGTDTIGGKTVTDGNTTASLVIPTIHRFSFRRGQQENTVPSDDNVDETSNREWIPIHYAKPETAFFHPNAHTMLRALEWMMERVRCIRLSKQGCNNDDNDNVKDRSGGIDQNDKSMSSLSSSSPSSCRMLEMYCGCGAHTVPLASSGLLSSIVAVELDQRLVQACKENCRRNGLSTKVQVVAGDAAQWARKLLLRERKKQNDRLNTHDGDDYDVLLVDTPRMGLDEDVCRLAIEGPFQHVLYISCGRRALQRDLERLHEHFRVWDCTLTDLFPRTDAVESLIHLVRR